MCGPIAFMLPVDRTNTYKKVSQITIYHVGRLLAYSLIGLIFGLIGKLFDKGKFSEIHDLYKKIKSNYHSQGLSLSKYFKE